MYRSKSRGFLSGLLFEQFVVVVVAHQKLGLEQEDDVLSYKLQVYPS
jgi:hypothetical protein